jgi:N-acetylmuramoyl-L-alanine amidase
MAAIAATLAWAGGCTGPAAASGRPAVTIAAPVVAVASPAPRPEEARPVPDPPPRLWPFRHIFGADYVDVAAIAERYGFKRAWVTGGRVLDLVDAAGRVRLKFEDRSRDFHLDGVRVFMGEPTVGYQGSLWVSKIDVIKTIAPLVRPDEHAGLLPRPPRLIVLDPGHGGNDSGTQNVALHLEEKTMTLDVVLRLRKVLEARGYRVILTRSTDRRVELETRPGIANEAKADLFISVHFNKAEASVSGTETYALTPQFQESTQPERDREMIPTPYPGNRQDYANTVLGFEMQRRLLADLRTSDRGFKRARWVVLRFADCPAILIEAAFLSNGPEARRVATPEFRQRIAEAIADGVDDYRALLASVHPGETRPAAVASP